MNATAFHDPEEARKVEQSDFCDETFDEDDTDSHVAPKDVFAFNELRSCSDLVRMYEDRYLQIDPSFQRGFVWNNPAQTKFIDSLVKRLPIPSMCIALDRRDDQRMVIDGRQRITTILRFLLADPSKLPLVGNKPWRLYKSQEIDQKISGKTPEEIKQGERKIFNRVRDQALPITFLHCDLGKKDHMEYIFTIFHRLNRGGMKLSNQEIRNCIYDGSLNQLLHRLSIVPEWRRLNRMADNDGRRFEQELILRFFAFFYWGMEAYRGSMARFLNDFMDEHQNDALEEIENKEEIFRRVVLVFSKIFQGQTPERRIPANILYPAMVGIARNIDCLSTESDRGLQKRYESYINKDIFKKTAAALADPAQVKGRLDAADEVFSAAG